MLDEADEREAREHLIEVARHPSARIAYSDLAAKIRSIPFRGDEKPFHTLIGQISIEEHQAGRGMLSVLVVHKGGDNRPGAGFYELAQLLGHKSKDREKVWCEEFEKVKAAWKKT